MREEYEVGIDGRVRNCRTTQSSGDANADSAVCAAITQRYRFHPARDSEGRPFVATFGEFHEWIFEDERGGEDPPPR
jgi:protein TonB